MFNREKFKEEILNIVCYGNAVAIEKETGKPVACNTLSKDCRECLFCGDRTPCSILFKRWCYSEYVPKVDWSKVKVDTPILVRDSEKHDWLRRYFSHTFDGEVYVFTNGQTSWTTEYGDTVKYIYAKLAEENDEE